MEIGACIFDLDGVICDTAKYHYKAWKHLANILGFDFTLEQNERLKGVSRMESLDILLEVGNITASHEYKLEWASMKNYWYVEYLMDMDEQEILPGVKCFIEDLRVKGIKVALGSASKNASIILKKLKIETYFDEIVDGTKVTEAKPNPEVFLKAALGVGVPPKNCIVFEDSVAGIEAAQRAGMKSIGVGTHITLQKADMVIEGFNGISSDWLGLPR